MAKTRWYFATCPRGLEALLEEEIQPWGAAEVQARTGGVAFRSGLRTAYGVTLWSRVAGRVLEELVRGRIGGADDVYKVAQRVSWKKVLGPEQTFAIAAAGGSHLISNTHFASLKVKDALADQLRDATGSRPSVDLLDPDVPLRLHLAGNVMTLSRDLSGPSLHKRGYRGALHKSPLNEALAAGLLMLSGWDRQQPLCDPLCGSGTFLIEAAFLAGDRAPGLRRSMQHERWPDHDGKLWKSLLAEAEQRWETGRSKIPALYGNDQHPVAVRMARRDAAEAEVEVEITEGAIADYSTDARFVVTNPPYGERLEGPEPTWVDLGAFLKRGPGTEAWILSGEPELTRSLRMKTTRRIPVRNGSIDCRWLQYLVREVI